MEFGQGMTSAVIRLCQPILIHEDWERRAADYGALYPEGEPAKSSLGVPIMIGDASTGSGQAAIGMISLQSFTHENIFTEADVRLLTTLAANVGVALETRGFSRPSASARRSWPSSTASGRRWPRTSSSLR